MKNPKKLIAIATMVALLVLAAVTCAMADEKIYTSPVFKLPKDKIQQWVETLPDEKETEEEAEETAEPAESEEPTAEPDESKEPADEPAEGETPAAEPAESVTPAAEPTEGVEPTTEPAEGEEPAAETTEGEEPASEPAEGEESAAEPAEEEPAAESAEGGEAEETAEPAEPELSVSIFSSQGDVVTEGEIIYLTSVLKGFDGLDVTYQWQVDRDDGKGWVDVEGATRDRHMFVASKETIKYSWRLLVRVNE